MFRADARTWCSSASTASSPPAGSTPNWLSSSRPPELARSSPASYATSPSPTHTHHTPEDGALHTADPTFSAVSCTRCRRLWVQNGGERVLENFRDRFVLTLKSEQEVWNRGHRVLALEWF